MTYETESRDTDRPEPDVLSAWGVYILTVAGLAMYSLVHLFS
jgi:hypothetical protein